MPTEQPGSQVRSLADQRVLRLAFGTAAAVLVSQLFAWQQSYLAAVITATFLAMPIGSPSFKGGLVFLLAMSAALLAGLGVLLVLEHFDIAGLTLLGLAFFLVFYFSVRGGNPLVVMLALASLAVLPVVGVVSPAAALGVCVSLLRAGLLGLAVLWLSHALFPDPPAQTLARPAAGAVPDSQSAARLAMRSTLVVLPVITWLLTTSGLSYVAVAIKAGSLGAQASADSSRQAGMGLLLSTLIGGVAAVGIWFVLKIWPSLLLYTLLVGLAGLLIGRRVFAGPGLAATGQVWSYGYVTALIILGPAVLDSGDGAGARFVDRILMFALATVYSVVAVWFFDTILSRRRAVGETDLGDSAA